MQIIMSSYGSVGAQQNFVLTLIALLEARDLLEYALHDRVQQTSAAQLSHLLDS